MNKIVRPSMFSNAGSKKSAADFSGELNSTISYRALEPRIAFDGAAAATAAVTVEQQGDAPAAGGDAAGEPVSEVSNDQTVTAAADGSGADFPESLAAAMADTPSPQVVPAQTVVFVDRAIENIDQVISAISPDYEVVLIDASSSGLDQIAAHLSGRSDIGSIHIVSHGEAGTLYLGLDALTSANLAAHAAALATIGSALSDTGDILLYGCEIGNGTGGMDFVRAFANATNADVAASVDNTGGDEAGGDWVLEATAGAIEGTALSNPLYAGLLLKTNTGAWTANGATAANDWVNTVDGVTTTVTFNAAFSAASGVQTLNTIAAFDNAAQGGASLGAQWNSGAGTVTITFSTAITNPVIHLDRLGGVNGTSNSSLWTLATAGASLTRLSGPVHFQVDSAAGTIQRTTGAATAGSESSLISTTGTAAGSVRVNGTFTTITFTVGQASGPTGADGFEMAFAIDAPPVAVNDTFTTAHDTPVTINVRANDSDVRGDAFNVTQVNGTAITAGGAGVAVTGGVVALNASGNLVFTPNANYIGSPSFTYTIADPNGGTSTATVSGTVTNIAPALDLDASGAGTGWTATFTENGSAVSIADADAILTDADDSNMESASVTLTNPQTGDRLLVIGSSALSGTFASGITWTRTDTTVTLAGSFTNAQYAAALQLIQFENTTDTPSTTPRIINTIVNDGNVASNTAVTTITIDRAPDPVNDAYTGNEDTAISGTVLTNDDLGDTPITSVTVAAGPVNGTLTSFNTATGAFVYTPGANFNGSDTFTYTVTDADGDTKTATVTITVNPVNDLPIAGNDTFTTVHDQPVVISVLANDSDVETPILAITQINGLPISVGDSGVTVTGGVVTLNAGGTLTFTPNADYAGSPSFTYTVADSNGATATATVSGTVTNVGPILDLDASGAGTGWTTTFTENGAAVGIADLDAAIVDADDTNMSSATVALTNPQTSDRLLVDGSSAASGTLASGIAWTRTNTNVTLSGSFTKAQYAAALALIQFENTSDAPSTAPRIINVVVNDGTANSNKSQATININLAPDPQNDAFTGNEDTPVTGSVLANDTDIGTTPSVANPLSVDSGPSNGTLTAFNTATGAFSYTPNANFAGTDSFVYRYTDGNGDSKTATVTFTINAVDDTPFIDLNSDGSPGDKDRDFVTEFSTGSSTPIAIVDVDADIFEDGEDDVVKVTIVAGGKGLDGTDIVTIAGQVFKLDSDAAFIGVSYGSSSLDIVFNASTRTITVTFSGDPSKPIPQIELDKLVREITYFSSSITQPPSNRTFEFTVTDAGKNTSPAAIATVAFLPPPDAVDDTFTTAHDTPVEIDVRNNDKDPQGDPIFVTHVNGTAIISGGPGVAVTGGVVTLNASGNLEFTPASGYIGSPSFTYTIADATGGQDTATVAGTVTNDTPVLDLDASGTGTNWSATYTENGSAVSVADIDAVITDSDDTTMESAIVTLTNPQTGDRLLVNGSSATTGTIGAITWTRTDTTVTFSGSATSADYAAAIRAVQFDNTTDTPSTTARIINTTVNDGSIDSNTAVTTINIDLTPDPVNDAVSGNEDQVGGINGNVLANDTDLGNTPITSVTVLAAPANGATSFNTATGAFVYTPAPNFNGTDTFTYTVTDADGDTKTATVTITVAPTNDAPVNIVPGAQTTSEDTPLAITGVSVNDVDGSGVALTTTLSIPAGSGSLSISTLAGVTVTGAGTANMTISGTAAAINAAIATITYTPVADFNTGSPATPINLTVSTSDGIAPAVANTISITVTPVADITADSVATNEDAPVTFAPLGNDTFENADRTISAINGTAITAGGAGVVLAGVGTVTLDGAGNLTFTPVANYNGSPSFNYTVTSGGVTETAAVNLTVNAVNDAPTQTVPVAQTTNEDVAKVISGAAVADVDGGSITTTLSIPAGTGTLSVVTGGGAVITGNASGTVTISGTAAEINAAIASITYTPEPDYYGAAPMTMSTTDGAATASSTVAITVAPIADATNDSVSTNEDTAHTFNVLTGTNGAAADTFEGVEAVTGVTQPVNGSVTFAADGTITYTPAVNFNGTDTFTYTVTSGGVTETATVTVTVAAVNDAPVNTVPGAQTASEDTGLVFSTGNGNAITVADADSNVTTTLTVANGALTLGSISGVTVTGNGTGTVTVSGSPAAITAALAGLAFAPTADWNGTTSLNVSTSDGIAPATVSAVAITVSPVADIAPNTATTAEDTASTFNVLTNDNFENGGAIVSSVTQPANGLVTIGASGNVTYTPALNYNGTDTFTYTVTSGGVTETTTVTMTITPVNDAPVAAPAANQAGTDGAVDSYNAGALFTDVDNATLTFTASGLPAGLSINPATGLISGTIDGHASAGGTGGVYNITVTATDASGALATTTFTWTVANPAPIAVNEAYTGTEDTNITGNVRTNDSDPDGDVLTVNTTPVSGPSNGTLVLNSNGTFTYTPAGNFTGTDTFIYQVTDADGATSTATVTLYVNPINDSPLNTVPGNQSTAEDTPLVFVGPNAITITDVDSPIITTMLSVAHGTLTSVPIFGVTVLGDGTGSVTLTGSPAAITAALSGLQYINNPDYYGSDTLNIVSTDGIATTTANLAVTVAPVADIAADTVTTNEDASISFNVLTGTNGATADTFEGAPAVTGFTQPANGSVTVDGAGNVVYTHNTNFNGADTFSYTVTSGGVTETTTVTVNVTPVNDTPVLTVPAAQNGTEDTPVIFSGANANQIILGDVDAAAALTTTISVPAGTLNAIVTPGVTITGNGSGSVTLSGSPAAITAALNGLTYTPVADANGNVTMSISTTDGVIAAPVAGSVMINLAPVSDIQNDNASTSEDTAKIISVLGNDTFENAGAAVTGVTNGANGLVTINGDGTVTYTPNANFNGSDSFTYTVTSGGVTETATVTVVVSPVNDAPVQTVPAAQVTAEDTGLSFSPATGNAVTVADLDGDTLTTTVSVTNGTIDLGAFAGVTVSGNNTGIVTITGSAAAINAALDGLTYNPTPDYHGGAVLSVTTSDGAAFATNTIAITVTPVTDITADTISTNEDTPITVNVMSNDTFENGTAAISAVTQPAHGTVSIGAGGLVTYTPAANYNGPDSFTYTVTSGGVTETATVSVTVVSVNDAPVTSVPGGQTTNEDAPLVLSSTNGNAITVSDLDGDTLTVTLSGTNGVLTLGSVLGVTVSGDGTGIVTVSGSAAAINAALNGLTFAPTADYNGIAAISVTTSDGTVTTSKTIGISVNPVVDIVADTVSTNEDVPVTFNVLTNDSFESSGKAVTSITQGASGTTSFLADGTLVYTPNINFHGTDTFTYTVTSGGVTETTTVTVTIGEVNDIPTTSGLADRSSLDGQTVSLNVAAVFADTDNATLVYSATGLPPGLTLNPATGVISGTIDKSASQTGPYTVIVSASDGNPGGSVSTSFTWNVSNPGPTAVNDVSATNEDTLVNINVLVNDTDPDSDPLTVTAATAGNGTVTIKPDGTIDYTPNPNFNGTDTIVYQISDGNGGVSTATVTVTIAPVNDVPDAMTPPDLIDADSQSITLDFSGAFSDIDGDTLTYSIKGLPPGLSFDTATGRITGTIAANASSPSGDEIYPISITADDGNGGAVTTTFNWRILNLPPASGDDAVTTTEDTPVVATVLSNDFDPDGDPLVITHINGTAISAGNPVTTPHGVVSLETDAFGNQVLVYTPNANFNGVETIIYTTSDGNTGADTATLTITVTPVNDAPVAGALANLTNNDSDAISVNVSSFFSDIDSGQGDTLGFSAIGLPAGLTINPATGVISGSIDPSASQSGPYTVIVTGTDEGGATVSQSFTWTVNNPKPTAVNDAQTIAQGSNLGVDAVSGILSNDTDPDNDPLTVSAINGSAVSVGTSVAGSSGGLFTVQPDGSYTFDQNGAFIDLQGGETRTTLISYTLSDGNGGLSTATLAITVTGVNDAPVATPLGAVTTIDNAPLTLNAAAAFTDADNDTLTFSATGLPAGLSIDPNTGLITGTIDRAASQGGAGGVYTATIFADDQNGGVTPVTLTITITNPAPIAANDVAPAVEDTPVTGNVLGNDTDPDGDTISVSEFTVAGVSGTFLPGDVADIPGVGTIEISSTGAYTFTPALNYNGPVPEITYTLSDGNGGTDTATLNLGPVSPVNDDPTSAPIAALSSADSANVTVNLASHFSDVDGNALTFAATDLPPGLSMDPDTGIITGTIDHLASAAGGTYSVTITATDPDGKVTSQVFTWTVTNPAPVGPDIPGSSGVDSTSVSIAAGTGFSDPDGDTIAFSATGLPSGLTIDPTTGLITGNLSNNASVGGPLFNGVYDITVTATDSQGATVSKTFTYIVSNPAPAAGNDAFSGVEDTPVIGAVGGNDGDPDGDGLSYSLVSGPAHGTLTFNDDGTFTYNPDPNFNSNSGTDTFTYVVSDENGASATATVTLTIAPVNDLPAAANVFESTPEDMPFTGTLTGTDVDGDTLTFSKASNPSNGTVTVNPDGSYTYTPNTNFTGSDTFTYKVSDGNGGEIIRTVTVNVIGLNDNPVAVNDAFSGAEDTNLTGDLTPGTSGQDSDIDGDTLVIFDADGNAANGISPVTAPLHGTLVLNANGTFVYTPDANFNGTDSFTYRISDGNGGFAEATVTLTIDPVNDAPVAANATLTTQEDKPFSGQLPAVSDVDGDPVTYAKGSNPAHGTVVVNPDGTYVYKPAPNYFGPDTFTYTVSDGKGGVTAYTVTILVTPVNDAPVAKNDSAVVRPGSSGSVPVLGNDTDLDGDKLTVTKATAGQGSVCIMPDGSVSYTPRPGFAGIDTITYIVSDGHGGFATATVTIVVEDAGYVEQPVVFGFGGPAISPDNDDGIDGGGYESIGAEGAVVDAVFDMGSLRSLANQLGTDGVVIAAANGARSLGGMGSLGADGVITETIRAERAREMLSYAGLHLRVFGGGIDGLTGFSLRNNVPGNLGGLGSSEQVIIESLVRNRTLIIQISNTIDPGTKRIADYKITRADGTPLPEWLDRAGKDLLIGERAADEEIIQIRVEAVYTDGSIVVQDVQIETSTGEIQPLKPGKEGSLAPELFGDQFRARPMLTPDQIYSLGRAIAR